MILASPFSEPVRLEVRGSLWTALLILVPILMIAMSVIVFTPLSWYLLSIPLLILLATAGYFLRLHYWQTARSSVLEINQDADKQWAVRVSGGWQLVELLPNSYISPWLIVLNFRGKTGTLTAILPADSLDTETHRRLRVRIKMAFS